MLVATLPAAALLSEPRRLLGALRGGGGAADRGPAAAAVAVQAADCGDSAAIGARLLLGPAVAGVLPSLLAAETRLLKGRSAAAPPADAALLVAGGQGWR